ncbi:hypothetical protein SAMN02910456_00619 [Ruminococcaceae bacterium YRB3002]|nr:hypothetical protein SAMN02910456_00619 [Ruminococcaceae bacterium YRB3002]
MLSRAEAKVKIKEITTNNKPIKTGMTLPIRKGVTFNVYKVPLAYLVPNILNDRITWKIREFEAENNRKLNIESDDDVQFLYDVILKEHPAENERTKADLAKNGQQVDGVITNDGIIIDGNRRATLLRALFSGDADKYGQKIEDFRYFNTIILPEDIDAKEIMALETMLQIGADEKVGYNRICLYVKVDNLLNAGYTYPQIKQYMNLKSDKDVGEMKSTFDLMMEYLKAIGKPSHFTLLDGLEDQFLNVKTVFKRLENGTYDAQWDYKTGDVIEFKQVCYDYMRAKFEGKKFRDVLVGKPNKTNGVFIEKPVWDSFLQHHNSIIDSNNPSSEADWQYLGKKGGKLDQNLNDAVNKLQSVLNDKDLSKLIVEVRGKVDRISELVEGMEDISSDDLNNLKEISKTIYKITSSYKV